MFWDCSVHSLGGNPKPQGDHDWMVERATELFDQALEVCWDEQNGGIFYGFAPDGTICDSDKYFWYNTRQPDARGLPAPIKILLDELSQCD